MVDSVDSSSDFQILLSFSQAYGNCSKYTSYKWYQRHQHVPQMFRLSGTIEVLVCFRFILFYSVVRRNNKINEIFFLVILYKVWSSVCD